MKKAVLYLISALIAIGLLHHFSYQAGRKDQHLQYLTEMAVSDKLAQVKEVYTSRGLTAVANYCANGQEEHLTSLGTFWTKCGAAAEFFDPKTYKTEVRGNDIILPVGVYALAEPSGDLLSQGYQAKNINLFASAWDYDPKIGFGAELANREAHFK